MNYSETKTIIDLSDAQSISELGMKITNVLDSETGAGKELFLNLGNMDLKQSQLLSIKALVEAMQSKLAGIQTTSEMTETAAIGLGLIVGEANNDSRPTFNDTFKTQTESIEQTGELNSFSQLKQNSIGDMVSETEGLSEVQDENLKEETEEFLAEAEADDSEDIEENVNENNIEEYETETTNIYEELSKETTPSDEIQSALDITFGATTIDENSPIDNMLTENKNTESEIYTPVSIQERFEDYEVTETVEKADEGKYILLDTEGITPEGIELIKSNTSDLPTLYLTQTLRSGQTVSYEGNIFLIGDAHPGSEIIATGDVTIWGILGGIVHAGSKGNTEAKVRALKLNPIQLRIANLYSRRNDTVNVPFVQKSNEFTPEEARIENEQIVIYKTLRRED